MGRCFGEKVTEVTGTEGYLSPRQGSRKGPDPAPRRSCLYTEPLSYLCKNFLVPHSVLPAKVMQDEVYALALREGIVLLWIELYLVSVAYNTQ